MKTPLVQIIPRDLFQSIWNKSLAESSPIEVPIFSLFSNLFVDFNLCNQITAFIWDFIGGNFSGIKLYSYWYFIISRGMPKTYFHTFKWQSRWKQSIQRLNWQQVQKNNPIVLLQVFFFHHYISLKNLFINIRAMIEVVFFVKTLVFSATHCLWIYLIYLVSFFK